MESSLGLRGLRGQLSVGRVLASGPTTISSTAVQEEFMGRISGEENRRELVGDQGRKVVDSTTPLRIWSKAEARRRMEEEAE